MASEIGDFLKNKFYKNNVSLDTLRHENGALYHGMKLENAIKALELGKLDARTTQRYWDDGQYLKDNHPKYEESGWMYGWSTSRDRFLASTFGDVLMVFDKDKIKENFKIQPISWNYRISQGSQYFKKEREDFIISHKNPLPLKNDILLESYHNYLDNLKDEEQSPYEDCYEYHRLHNMKTKKLDLKNVLKEFYIDNSAFEIYGESRLKNIDALTESKYFKGFFNRDDSRKKMEQSSGDVYKAKRLKF